MLRIVRKRHRRVLVPPSMEAGVAFDAIYQDHSKAVYGFVRRICGPKFAADVTQDVFIDLLNHPESFDPARGSLRSFLLVNANGRAIDVLRSESARARREQQRTRRTPADVAEADNDLIERERSVRIATAIGELPGSERDAIVSAFYGEATYREAARILSMPEGACRARIRTGLMTLRRSLADPPSQTPLRSGLVSTKRTATESKPRLQFP